MAATRWGIIGPGGIARNFADGMKEAASGEIVAVASRDEGRGSAFCDAFGIDPGKRYRDYAALADDGDVDAIYIATPHRFHAELAIMAMRAGKAALTEKPAGLTAAEVVAMTEVAAQEDVFFAEGFMYRCHPQIARLVEIVRSGEIGAVRHIRAALTFRAGFDPSSRLFDRALGGGGILDVGCYPVSLSRLVAGVASGRGFDDPVSVKGTGRMGASQVDEEAYALLTFAGGITASCTAAVAQELGSDATIHGERGDIRLPDPWIPGKFGGPSDATIEVTVDGTTRTEAIRQPEHLFAFEAETMSRAIADGKREPDPPAATWADSIGNAETLDRWRREVGYDWTVDDGAVARVLTHLLPKNLPAVPRRDMPGVGPVSQLILGCDNRDTVADGAVVWDAWMEAGGNAFDTAFVYGGGAHEAALGQWIAARGVADDVVVVAKGGHTPYCLPGAIAPQLDRSLERLGLDRAPVYILHRDNPEVPAGEFVDALNRERERGRIGIFGGSNWTLARFEEANAYAAANGLEPLRILNNNLSLAVMERPVWPGCVSSNDAETLRRLRDRDIIHLSWSSQARGYFLPERLRDRLPAETGPEGCFGSEANAERRRRAEELAADRGVSAHNVATAWVLAQSFPSFALIGPRSPGEIASTLPALTLDLAADEVAWLNLED